MRRKRFHFLAAAATSLVVLAAFGPWAVLHVATSGRRYDDVATTPRAPVAIVFGAGLRPDGGLSPFLTDRIDLAARLYRAGRVGQLLVTGDHGRTDHDEVSAMAAYAVTLGVPESVITHDHAGFDTYDSCYRARAIFGVTRAVLVSQDYHLARAVYTCRRRGIDAIGVGVSEWSRHRDDMIRYQAREFLSSAKALWELHVTRPKPRFLGPPETLR